MSRHRLSPLLDPASVAVYGASEREGSIGRRLMASLRDGGFGGPVGAINPKRNEVFGARCVADAGGLEFVPDVALAAVPATALPSVVDDCAGRGTRFVVVFSPGSDASTEAGRAAQAELLRHARARGVRLVGPGCMTLMRPASGFGAGASPRTVKSGGVALLSQSGALAASLLDWAAPAGIGLSSALSLGRALDLDFGEILDWYLFDARTDSVLLYLEGVRDARRFMSSVRALARVKPVVVMKAGRRPAPDDDGPARAAASHSDALTGNDRVFDAAIARAGAVRAETTMQLLAAARLLALRKRPAGPRLAIVANGAGPGVIAADAVAHGTLELARLSPATIDALDRAVPGCGTRGNPMDLRADVDPPRIAAALRAVLDDAEVDAALVLLVPQPDTHPERAAEAVVAAAAERAKPIAAVVAGGTSAAAGQRVLDAAGIAQFLTPENAVDALSLLQRFAVNQRKLREVPDAIDEGFVPDLAGADALHRRAVAEGRMRLDEVESKALLGCFGIAAPPSIVVADAREAADAAARLGFPVVLKILSPDIARKSDVGGVRINVHSANAAHAAADDILESVARLRPDARIAGLVVQPMVRSRHQREVHLGMATDPMFGAVIAFGAGGVAVEQIDDVAIGLPPLNAPLARALVGRTRIARLLRAYRNVPGVDAVRLEQTLVRFSALVCACPWIGSLDINPLVVDEHGAVALDARVVVADPDAAAGPRWRGAYGHLAIHPYPRELEESVSLANGTRVRLRPIRPEDADLERAFVAALSPRTLYRRFMMPVRELSAAMIERFTQIDYDRELALVALEPDAAGLRMCGVARITPTWTEGTAEFAIVVGDWMHRSGLGRAMMTRLFDAARMRGYDTIEGVVLGENVAMQTFCRQLGFTLSINPEDASERLARRSLV